MHDSFDHLLYSFTSFTAPVGNGIEYFEEGQGKPLLFLHGALSNRNTWRKILPLLAPGYRCIAPSLPLGGHRIPAGKDADLSPLGIAGLIGAFMTSLGIEKAVLIANDTGGAYAQVFASLYPERVEKLVLSNCEGLDVFPPAKFSYLKTAVRIPGFNALMGKALGLKRFLKSDSMLGLLSFEVTKEEFYDLYVYHFVKDKNIRDDFAGVASGWDPRYTLEAAGKLKVFPRPVLILWGNKDLKLFPLELGKRLAGIFPVVEMVEIENSRTYIQEDQPGKVALEILRFVSAPAKEMLFRQP